MGQFHSVSVALSVPFGSRDRKKNEKMLPIAGTGTPKRCHKLQNGDAMVMSCPGDGEEEMLRPLKKDPSSSPSLSTRPVATQGAHFPAQLTSAVPSCPSLAGLGKHY